MSVYVGGTVDAAETLHVVNCPTCGVVYAIPDGLYRYAKKWKRQASIYCPASHAWHFTGRTHEEELRDARDEAARDRAARDQAEADARLARAREAKERKARQRLKARASGGVCPCCNRTFQQLARHMTTKHPKYVAET